MRLANTFSVLGPALSRPAVQYGRPQWTLCLPLLTLTALVLAPPDLRLISSVFACITFVLMQWLIPECRFRKDNIYCAQNLAFALFLMRLVIVPVLIMAVGPVQSVLPFLPSKESMEWALVIDVFSFIGFCLGMRYMSARPLSRTHGTIAAALSRVPSRGLVIAFVVLGAIGFVVAFGSIGRFLEYFRDPYTDGQLTKELSGSWKGFLGTVLRPFLAIGFVSVWARQLDISFHRNKAWKYLAGAAVLAVAIVIANLTFSFNRAAFLFPLASLIAVCNVRVKRISLAMIGTLAACAIPFLISLGHYRTTPVPVGVEYEVPKTLFASFEDLSEHIQIYMTGPQYTGFFYQETGWGQHLLGGSSLAASALSPIPILGKGSREISGLAIFNRAIYGNLGYEDQIIPLDCELFANFHLPGVVLGFFGLGMLLASLQRLFDSVTSAFGLFTIHYVGIWGAMLTVWSLAIYVQILFYFCIPFYTFLALNALRKLIRSTRRTVPVSAVSIGEFAR
ncbi:MAG: hypothetical protein ABI824_07695 [Acidobacteriota bacterium]